MIGTHITDEMVGTLSSDQELNGNHFRRNGSAWMFTRIEGMLCCSEQKHKRIDLYLHVACRSTDQKDLAHVIVSNGYICCYNIVTGLDSFSRKMCKGELQCQRKRVVL